MTSELLSSVVRDVLKNNRKTGKSVVLAYRVGGKRLIQKSGVDKLGNGGQKVTSILLKGINKVSNGAEGLVDTVYDRASQAVEKVAETVDGVGNEYATQYFDLVSKAAMPGAKIARGLSGKVATRISKIYGNGQAPARRVVNKVVRKRRAAVAK